jgi:hypothetical protein
MSQPSSDKVTLEDLLRLKRAERPSAEFWTQFDRELQAKQLAALVGKKRWWHSTARMIARFSYLPLGATAALAFALIAAHQYFAPVADIASSRQLHAAAVKIAPAPVSQLSATTPSEKTNSMTVASVQPASHPAAPAATRESPVAITWLADTLESASATPQPDNSMRVSFADASIASPRPASNLEPMDEARARHTADPLSQVSSPTETQHARLLAALTDVRLVSMVDPVTLMHQRLATRVGDDGLADDAGRFDASGNSVSLKF